VITLVVAVVASVAVFGNRSPVVPQQAASPTPAQPTPTQPAGPSPTPIPQVPPGPDIAWSIEHGANSVAVAPDGTIIVTGWATIARFAPDGTLMWEQNLAGSGDVAVDGEGRIIVIVSTTVQCLSLDGSLVWTTSVGGFLRRVAVDQDGSIVVIGTVVARLTHDGDLEWVKEANSIMDGIKLWDVAIAPDGTILAGGSSVPPGESDPFATAATLTPDGDVIWAKTLDGNKTELVGVAAAPDGGMIAVKSSSIHRNPVGVVSLTRDGEVAWFKPMTNWHQYATKYALKNEGFAGVTTGPDGRILVIGDMEGSGGRESYQAFITSMTPGGDLIWTKTLVVGYSNTIYKYGGLTGVAGSPDGSVVAVGRTCSYAEECRAVIVSLKP